jgi:hypothetical protein
MDPLKNLVRALTETFSSQGHFFSAVVSVFRRDGMAFTLTHGDIPEGFTGTGKDLLRARGIGAVAFINRLHYEEKNERAANDLHSALHILIAQFAREEQIYALRYGPHEWHVAGRMRCRYRADG